MLWLRVSGGKQRLPDTIQPGGIEKATEASMTQSSVLHRSKHSETVVCILLTQAMMQLKP